MQPLHALTPGGNAPLYAFMGPKLEKNIQGFEVPDDPWVYGPVGSLSNIPPLTWILYLKMIVDTDNVSHVTYCMVILVTASA